MAFKHISANRLSFLLTSDGVPSGMLVNGENIPVGSLSIDRINGKLYQLLPNFSWQEIAAATGGTTELFEELSPASTSAPLTYHLGFNPLAGSVKVFVNGLLAIPDPAQHHDYTLSGMTITWSLTPNYPVDPTDQIVVYYDTTDI